MCIPEGVPFGGAGLTLAPRQWWHDNVCRIADNQNGKARNQLTTNWNQSGTTKGNDRATMISDIRRGSNGQQESGKNELSCCLCRNLRSSIAFCVTGKGNTDKSIKAGFRA